MSTASSSRRDVPDPESIPTRDCGGAQALPSTATLMGRPSGCVRWLLSAMTAFRRRLRPAEVSGGSPSCTSGRPSQPRLSTCSLSPHTTTLLASRSRYFSSYSWITVSWSASRKRKSPAPPRSATIAAICLDTGPFPITTTTGDTDDEYVGTLSTATDMDSDVVVGASFTVWSVSSILVSTKTCLFSNSVSDDTLTSDMISLNFAFTSSIEVKVSVAVTSLELADLDL
mmetsp:Transcript_15117/g.20729  ORF Transcript_15117/g.20729 Transcript_15117/m.20729 type:complete len:228 (-) Transcript_15117:276-959(-)